MNAWHDRAKVKTLSPEETQKIIPSEFTFYNLNTPEDFQEAETLAKQYNLI